MKVEQKMTTPAISETQFSFPGQTNFYRGKVRDVYTIGETLVVIASDRISAFDYILPRPIPYKGAVLNQIAAYFLEATRDIVPNWLVACPHPNVAIGKKCEPVRIEMVIRGYLAGHAAREYKAGKRTLCGVQLPERLRESDKLPRPIITPSTKAKEGHDEDISKVEILKLGLVNADVYAQMEKYTFALYTRGQQMANSQGLILVDTKYEFGISEGEVILIDEIHTPDSSRYFYLEGYEERQRRGESQKQLSKEFVREWLMSKGFQGKEGQQMPEMNDQIVNTISERYIELFELVTGKKFERGGTVSNLQSIEESVLQYLNTTEKGK